jgi:capsular polysaccharide export protein
VLVVGQVEDDASIRLGAGVVRTNLGLLTAAAHANPGARIIYKPHPDVEAGLRPGTIAEAQAGLWPTWSPHRPTRWPCCRLR